MVWKIENQLHWSLDVTFAEDQSRIHKGNGQAGMAMLRRLALSLLKKDTTMKASLKSKRMHAGWNLKHLEQFLAGK
jgi:predicted transposase YbfD/YdcC